MTPAEIDASVAKCRAKCVPYVPRFSRDPARPSAYEFKCGAVEWRGEVRIEWEHCVYLVTRGPTVFGARSLREARRVATTFRRAP
jgi:hypothetical protein